MKNILAKGGIEFLAVFLGIPLSLWVDYETKFIEHIDKFIFKNLVLNKIGTNWELDWHNEATLKGIKTTEFQNIIIGNRANREIIKEIAGQFIISKKNLLKSIKSCNSSI